MPHRSTPSDDTRRAALHTGKLVVVRGAGELSDAVADAFRRHGAHVQNTFTPAPVRADVWLSVITCPPANEKLLGGEVARIEAGIRHAALGCLVRARAAARSMAPGSGGVILTLLDTGTGPGPASVTSTVEGLTRALADELRPLGIRALGLRIRTATRPGAPEPVADPLALFAQAAMYGRVCSTAQIGEIACYLASAATAPVSGTFHVLHRSSPAR